MAAELVNELVASNKVMVFSKTHCPYCVKAKGALSSVGLASFGLLELDNHPQGDQIQDALLKLTGGRSVPRVFIGGKFVGGGDDTAAMGRDGRLKAALVAAGAM